MEDARPALAYADGAFVGVVRDVRRRDLSDVQYEFTVQTSVKGGIGRRVLVSSGGTCGLDLKRGERTALLVYRSEGRWTSGMCNGVNETELLRAAEPLPRANSAGPATFVLGSDLGGTTTVGLDASGRPVAYGQEDGRTYAIGMCPSRQAFAEAVVRRDGTSLVKVRALPSLRPVQVTELPQYAERAADGRPEVRQAACLEGSGGVQAAVFVDRAFDGIADEVVRVGPDGTVSEVWKGDASTVELDGGSHRAFIGQRAPAPRLVLVDLLGRRPAQVRELHAPVGALVVREDGNRVAALLGADPVVLAVFDGNGAPLAEHRLEGDGVSWSLAWSGDMLLVLRYGDVDVFTLSQTPRPAIEHLARWSDWIVRVMTATDGAVFGVDRHGSLIRADPRTGDRTEIAVLPTRSASALALVGGPPPGESGGGVSGPRFRWWLLVSLVVPIAFLVRRGRRQRHMRTSGVIGVSDVRGDGGGRRSAP